MEGPKFLGWSSFHQILKKKVIAPIWSTFFRGLGSFQKKKAIILKLLQRQGKFGWACWAVWGGFLFRGALPLLPPPS